MVGYFDEITRRKVRGWAVSDDGSPPDLSVAINGVTSIRFKPSLCRPDLKNVANSDLGFDEEVSRPLEIGDIVSITDKNGQHLTGSPKQLSYNNLTKQEKALWLVSRDMRILEIGPSFNPIAPRSKGWTSFSLDHASQDELRLKYRGQQHVDLIEPVDYVWTGGPIECAIPADEHGSFDVIIASHVIEHIPDPIAFFLSASVLLKEDGLISLVIPDKRRTFDFFKPVTSTSNYLEAHHTRRTRHSKKTAFDNIAYNVSEKGDIAWSTRPLEEFNFFGGDVLFDAMKIFDETIETEAAPYVDFHGTVYTPSSFYLIMLELSQLGVLPFTVARTFPTAGCEFYVTLRKGQPARLSSSDLRAGRLRLMKAVVRELSQQAHWILDDEVGNL